MNKQRKRNEGEELPIKKGGVGGGGVHAPGRTSPELTLSALLKGRDSLDSQKGQNGGLAKEGVNTSSMI